MKNIAILTFINTINYGASLQAFALQEVIRKIGMNAEILEYTNKAVKSKEQNKNFNIKSIIKTFIIGKKIKKKIVAFQNFEYKNFKYGKKINSKDVFDYYDKFITGSDQVWNLEITNYDFTYFLDFVKDNNKKVAYAPSFGNNDFPGEYNEELKKNLCTFSSLSVREEKGKEIIKKVTGLDAKVVIDPTLLLSKSEWLEKTNFIPPIKDYILVYFPNNKKKVFEFAKKIQQETGLPIVYISVSPKKQFGVRTIYDASPNEFLGWIANASFVISGSYHGTIFSLNFEKQFYYEQTGNGSRIENIVKLTNTVDRNIDNGFNINEQIDYQKTSKIVSDLRSDSYIWLKNQLMKNMKK